ncbi:MAG TPA: mechanosensitive ion channel [Candidatus Bathyarchaeota archaeon]|nr:mechanosensitive ion channel [Candidatus Bathyarchaeota archaeon]
MNEAVKSSVIVSILLVSAILVWVINNYVYGLPYVPQIVYSLVVVAAVYTIKYLLDRWVASKILAKKAQFSFRRVIDIISALIIFLGVLLIWIGDPTTLIVSTGILGAGIAIALQDVFRNLAGGILTMVTNIYRIGDRIEVNGKHGDVLGIGLFNTTLLEIKEWINGDQATGRICVIPNSVVLSGTVHNYTKEFNFIWDEITVPITHESDWKQAYDKISAIVQRETGKISEEADEALRKLGERYYLTRRQAEPSIFVTITDNWIEFNIRYVTDVGTRRTTATNLSRLILEEIQKSENIHIASTTLTVSGGLDLKEKRP